MFRLIQVPLDGSSSAEQALPLAVGLAQRDEAALQIVRVHEPIAGMYLSWQETLVAKLDQELVDDMRVDLDATVKSLAEKAGISPDSIQLKGPIPETIARHASTSGANLLVMTTHGRGPLSRAWFGSVADSLVRQSPIPILFVRPQEKAPVFAQPHSVRRVLIPLDGSQLAEQALQPALSLGGGEKGEFTLLRVVPAVIPAAYVPTRGVHTSWHQQLFELKWQLEAEARDYLQRLAERLRVNSLNIHTHVVAHEQPAAAILEEASSRGADAVALTTRGQGGLKRLLIGSVADKVMRGAATPVLVCPSVAGPVIGE